MSSTTIPIFAPDGSLGDVPYERLHDAIAAGGKMGVNIQAPDGTRGVIPADRYQDANRAGAKVIPYDISGKAPQNQPGAMQTLANDVTASFTKRAPGESIQQQVAGGVMGTRGAQAVAKQKQQDIANGNVSGMFGHLAADEAPAVLGLAQVSGATGMASDAMASGVNKLKSLIPSTDRAGQLFGQVAKQANNIPVSLENTQESALNMMDWQKRTQLGPTINKFLNRITNPKLGPMTYEEARKEYQLLGQLSSDEASKLPPAVKRDLVQMVVGFKQDIGNAAEQVGQGSNYYSALNQYFKAKKIQDALGTAQDLGIKALKAAVPSAGAALAAKEIWDNVK